ncbi:MAG: hypothetical protein IPO93_18435 [Actinobacteria bacterium]|nr:hypothetical protein [Actinomycetota bacterium]
MNELAIGTRVRIDGQARTVVPDPDTDALVAGVLALLDDGREGLLRHDQETGQWTCWTPLAPMVRPVGLVERASWSFTATASRPRNEG